jgi:LysM repeat protein
MSIDNCPAMSLSEFENIPNGEVVFNHGASECVALANQFNEGVLSGGFVAVGAAKDWWFNENVASVHGFERITENPQHGDLFVASCEIYDCQYGHIGYVVRGWDGSTFGTIEQNAGGPGVSRHDRTMANVDGFLRTVRQDIVNPAPAPTPEPTPAPTPSNTVTVVPGDTLWDLSAQWLGDPTRWPELYAANKDVIGDNPDLIFPGQVLVIP